MTFSVRIISELLNLSKHGGTTISDEEFTNAWDIMRGEETPVEKMAHMHRNQFKADAYLISHIMDRSLEFKNGSKGCFTTHSFIIKWL